MRFLLQTVVAAVFIVAPAAADSASEKADRQIESGLNFLKSQQQPDGGWQQENQPPAITAIALKAFVQSGTYNASTDFVARGYEKLLTYQVESGGIYKNLLANYNTSIALSSLAAANDPRFKPQMDRAVAYLKGLQWTTDTRPEYVTQASDKFPEESAGKQVVESDDDAFFGGWGYGGRSRGRGSPDLSNAAMALEALHDAGLQPDDPAFQNAVKFVSRLQNNSETNSSAWAANDGGFIYAPGGERQGDSAAGEYIDPAGRRLLRSYGSMTYAGLKSLLYAGLSKEDQRVRAAHHWVSENWTLDENPGMKYAQTGAQSGLYYYFHVIARALNAYDEPTITSPDGASHDWRIELINKIGSLQKPDGSWIGDKRWMESNPVLVTAYCVLALEEAKADLREHPVSKSR